MENKTILFVLVAILFVASSLNVEASPRRRWLERLMERERLAAIASENNSAVTGAGAGASASTGTGVGGTGVGSGSGSYGSAYEPFRMERINRGISTILNGVRMGSLEEILRGSFMFTRNNNVRGVADNVISSVFGTPVRNEGNLDAFGQPLNPADIRVGNNNKDNNNLNNAVGSTSASSSSTNSRG